MTKTPYVPPCSHLYGHVINGTQVNEDNYELQMRSIDFVRFTYCPFCRTQLHTIDGIPLGLSWLEVEEDCQKGGCND